MHRIPLRPHGASRAARSLHVAAVGALLLAAACAVEEESPRGGTATDSIQSPAPVAVEPATGGPDGAADESCAGEGATVMGRRVGALSLGMTADELRRACRVADTTFTLGEGLQERGLATRVAGASVVALLGPGDTVTRILVREAGPVTGSRIGVTSDLGAVRARHPGMCALVGEGRIVVAAPDLPGVSFVTTADYGRFATTAADRRASALPDSARVTEIWVHGVEKVCGGE